MNENEGKINILFFLRRATINFLETSPLITGILISEFRQPLAFPAVRALRL